jgi:hypothetical protein
MTVQVVQEKLMEPLEMFRAILGEAYVFTDEESLTPYKRRPLPKLP